MGTNNSSAFKDAPKPSDPSKNDIYFNGPGDSAHGHVVTSTGSDGETIYHYVRDVEQNVYIDDRDDDD